MPGRLGVAVDNAVHGIGCHSFTGNIFESGRLPPVRGGMVPIIEPLCPEADLHLRESIKLRSIVMAGIAPSYSPIDRPMRKIINQKLAQ